MWAHEVATRLIGGGRPALLQAVTEALLRAKADGMRKAAKYAPDAKTYDHILELAAAEERGQ